VFEIIAWSRSHVDYKAVGFESPIPIRHLVERHLGQHLPLKDTLGAVRKPLEPRRVEACKCEAQ
jgi:transposase InsO family protein